MQQSRLVLASASSGRFSREDARAFFTGKVRDGVAGGRRVLFAASVDGRVVGTVQLDMDLPPNQTHRADVSKLLVHPDARRQGLARKLMIALEDEARARGLALVVLDTRTGDAAEPLYSGLGYETAGQIPHFALAPEGRPYGRNDVICSSGFRRGACRTKPIPSTH